jgi:hypothetical protein
MGCWGGPRATSQTNRIHLVLFDIHDRTFGPYLNAVAVCASACRSRRRRSWKSSMQYLRSSASRRRRPTQQRKLKRMHQRQAQHAVRGCTGCATCDRIDLRRASTCMSVAA